MRHLKDEDIARMIEGNVSKKERETFLKHLSECNACFEVYTETLKFVEGEKQGKIPWIEKIKTTAHRFWEDLHTLFKNRKMVLVPGFAALIIILLMVPFLLKEFRLNEINKTQMQTVKKDIEEIKINKNKEASEFSPSNIQFKAAIRTGFLTEDLNMVIKTNKNKQLKTEIIRLLKEELRTIFNNKEPESLFNHLENINKKNIDAVVNEIRQLLGKKSLTPLYELCRFVERSILETDANKRPMEEEINRYVMTAQKYKDKYDLPEGIFQRLEEVKTNTEITETKKTLKKIRKMFLVLR